MKCTACIAIMLLAAPLCAQWEKLNPPAADSLICFGSNDTFLFIGTLGGEVIRSSDKGKSWLIGKSVTIFPDINYSINSVDYFLGTLFALTHNGPFRSTDNGETWAYGFNIPIGSPFPWTQVAIKNNLYADLYDTGVSANHIGRSLDNGKTWTPINKGLLPSGNAYILGVFDTSLFVDRGGAIYRTSNGTDSFIVADSGLSRLFIMYFASTKKTIFASAGEGIFRSTDNGSHWIPSGLNNRLQVTSLAVFNNIIFAGTAEGNQGFFLSTDEGISWTQNDIGLDSSAFILDQLFVYGNYIFLTSDGRSLWRRPLSDFGVNAVKSSDVNDNLFEIYPNPAENTLTIESSTNLSNVNCTLFDPLGRSVLNLDRLNFIGDKKVTLDISGIPSGMYFLRMTTDGISRSEAVVIRK